MKLFKRFLLLGLFFAPCVCGAQVATTAGSNLTAWNSGGGSANNNNWNTLMNNRTLAGGAGGATADFGNCNSLILRCAQPKCSACTTMELARPIVDGCVNSNKDCKKHGTELVEFISGQIVANAAAKAQQQELAIKQAEAQAAAAQNSQQMAQMQQQMQQMQADMQAQNAQQMQQMQAALDEQKALVAKAQQEAAAAQQAKIDAQTAPGVTVAQQAAINAGVSTDVMVRHQITGQVMTEIENAEDALKDLKSTMLTAFEYAGCDTRGNSCTGPKRVKIFKDKANQFFDPYNTVLDSLYDALIIAQSVGVDITEIYLMLSDSCNSWGEYICTDTTRFIYNNDNCPNGRSVPSVTTRGQHPCTDGQVIPAQDSPHCTMHRVLANKEDVQRGLLDPAENEDTMIRVGCASAALDASGLFANRKKQASIDIDTLQRILEQDAPSTCLSGWGEKKKTNCDENDFIKYCRVGEESYIELQKSAATKSLPKQVCTGDLETSSEKGGAALAKTGNNSAAGRAYYCSTNSDNVNECICKKTLNTNISWDDSKEECTCSEKDMVFSYIMGKCVHKNNIHKEEYEHIEECRDSGGTWDGSKYYCKCNEITHVTVGNKCESIPKEKICRDSGGTWDGQSCDCEGDNFMSSMTDYGACIRR
ncbi:MAG: hypothetical protein II238_00180 [Alphaproteobacteria bacterium]|nr:hypothetical protein [Alphaproteobacteria bacterium]